MYGGLLLAGLSFGLAKLLVVSTVYATNKSGIIRFLKTEFGMIGGKKLLIFF